MASGTAGGDAGVIHPGAGETGGGFVARLARGGGQNM